jgi:hypothetical protein
MQRNRWQTKSRTTLEEVPVPDHPDVFEALTGEEQNEAWKQAYLSLVVDIGEERARQHYPYWEDWIDEETGEVEPPSTDSDREISRRGRAFDAATTPTPIMVIVSDKNYDPGHHQGQTEADGSAKSVSKLPLITKRSMRTAGPSEDKIQARAVSRARTIARLRWIAEMQMKHRTDLADEEDFDNAGFTTGADMRRLAEILDEELSNPANIEFVRSLWRSTGGYRPTGQFLGHRPLDGIRHLGYCSAICSVSTIAGWALTLTVSRRS